MNYVELNIAVSDDEQAEIITAELADFPFESFRTEECVLKAYIPQEQLANCKIEVDEILEHYGITDKNYVSIETQNWNSLWESDFEPVDVDARLLIRAPFHTPADDSYEIEIVIMPHMSFGTGHHSTTYLMSKALLELDLKDKHGLDMGSGTGVLAILAAKRGASHIDAVDIDNWADESCRENIVINNIIDRITPILGDVRSIEGRRYDFILANINRNILLGDMSRYVATLDADGNLFMSGFLVQDIDAIKSCAELCGLQFVGSSIRDGWVMIHCKRCR